MDIDTKPATAAHEDASQDRTAHEVALEKASHEESPAASQEPASGEVQPSLLFSAMVVFGITFVGFTYGFDTGTISGYIGFPDYLRRFGTLNSAGHYELSTLRKSLIVSFYNIGAGAGALGLSPILNWRGRKPAVLLYIIIYCVGNIIQITSHKWYQMLIGRVVSGLLAGALSTVVPMYGAEVTPATATGTGKLSGPKIRGALILSFQLFVCFGIFMGYCCNYATKHHQSGAAQWQVVMGLNFVWSIIVFAMILFLAPELPRYMMTKGDEAGARKAISYVNRVPENHDAVEREFALIEEAMLQEKAAGNATWGDLITGQPKIFQRVSMGFLLLMFQQFTGINFFLYFATEIFASVGLKDTYQTSIIIGVINLSFTFVSLYLVDKFGRRSALLWGSVVGAVALYIYSILGVAALYPHGTSHPTDTGVGNAMIFLTCLFVASFACSWGPVPWVVLSESFPIKIRSKASSIGIFSCFFWNFAITFCTPYIVNAINFYFGFIFAGGITAAIVYIYFFVYETKGLTLEDVDILYSDPAVKPWTSGRWTPQGMNVKPAAAV